MKDKQITFSVEHKRTVNCFWAWFSYQLSTNQDRQATGKQMAITLPSASNLGMSMQALPATQLHCHWRNQEHMTMHMSRKPKTHSMVMCTCRRHAGTSTVRHIYHSAQRILPQHWTWRKIEATDNRGQKSHRIYAAIVTACCFTFSCPQTCKQGTPLYSCVSKPLEPYLTLQRI